MGRPGGFSQSKGSKHKAATTKPSGRKAAALKPTAQPAQKPAKKAREKPAPTAPTLGAVLDHLLHSAFLADYVESGCMAILGVDIEAYLRQWGGLLKYEQISISAATAMLTVAAFGSCDFIVCIGRSAPCLNAVLARMHASAHEFRMCTCMLLFQFLVWIENRYLITYIFAACCIGQFQKTVTDFE